MPMQCEDWCPCRCGQQSCGCHESKPRPISRPDYTIDQTSRDGQP